MAYICGCFPARIKRALADLPETLDGTYDRTLREINKADWELAHRMFQFVAVASRPLRIEELAELLAFDFSAGTIPKLREGWRLEDPVHAVSTCSSLLAIVNVYGSRNIVQFSHFSVMEFLTSNRLVEAHDNILRRYHVSITPAHTLVAQTCLGMLLHLDNDVTRDSLEKWPLAEYAAAHWADHARFERVSQYVGDGMKQLFDPSKPHLAVCVWIHDPEPKSWDLWDIREGTQRDETPSPLYFRTPLHYAAHWGLHFMIEFLVTEGYSQKMHVDLRSPYNETPLHLASKYGHVKAVRTLIEHGADVKAQSVHGLTPLHLASLQGQVDIARILIGHGVDVTAKDVQYGNTPLHLASQEGQVEVARMLIEHDVDVTALNMYRETPLHLAVQGNHAEVARMLFEHSMDVMGQYDGDTLLHLASQQGEVKVAHMLIERGADVTAQNKDEETPLHLASHYGQAEVAHMLIERGADVAAHNKTGETSLHLASHYGQVEVAHMLIERGADVTVQNKDGETPLHLASCYGKVEVARMLIERSADVTAQNKNGETPLHVASRHGQVEIAPVLIERGADVTAQNKNGESLLHLMSRREKVKAEVAHVLIERGADVAAKKEDGETLLHLALTPPLFPPLPHWDDIQGLTLSQPPGEVTEVELAHMLIDRGADVTAQNEDGDTPLHLALNQNQSWAFTQLLIPFSTRRQIEVACVLIDGGADVTAKNMYGETPLHLALTPPDQGLIKTWTPLSAPGLRADPLGPMWTQKLTQGEVEVVYMLIDCGANVTAQNKDGETPLHLASRRGEVAVFPMLVERGANISAQNKDRETPLHLASRYGQVEVAHMLIDHGADVTAQDTSGVTPLHVASSHGQAEVARMLIEHGADVTALGENGETPLHLASKRGQVEAVRMLIEHGADVNAQNEDGLTPFRLASQGRHSLEVMAILLEHGADTSELPASESSPVIGTIPTHSLADLPPSRPLRITSNVADIDLPQTPSFSQPPSKDIVVLECNPGRCPVFFTRSFLCSLGLVAIAIALPFFIRNVPQMLAAYRGNY